MTHDAKSATAGGTAPTSSASALQLRASRPGDVRHAPALRALITEAIRRGEVVEYRHLNRLEDALRSRWVVLALAEGRPVGFAMAMPWQEGRFVGHGAALVAGPYRLLDLAHRLGEHLMALSRRRWPGATVMGLALTQRAEEQATRLGFEPVPYCDLTTDLTFWDGCEGCEHFGHLKRNQHQDCHCWVGLALPPGEVRERVIPKDALTRPRPDLRYRACE